MTRSPFVDNARADERLRVALVTTELGVGGAERCAMQLALGLQARGHQVTVHSLAPPPLPPRDSLVLALQTAGVPVQFLHATRPWHAGAVIRQLGTALNSERPQVVQTFLYHANVLGSIAARRAGVGQIVTGLRVVDRRWLRVAVERWSSRRVQRVVSVSSSVDNFAATALQVPASKRLVIPNGIDLNRFRNIEPADLSAHAVPTGAPTLVAIGRLHEQKGFDWLIAQMPAILRHLPDHHLAIVGAGPRRAALEAQIQDLGLTGRVHLVGWQANVPSILRASVGLLSTSRWEGMPNVVLEAMAAGLPILATRVEGVLELLGDEAERQSIDWGDSAGFQAKLLNWASSHRVAQELGFANEQRARTEFSIATMIARYEALYRAL